jgi:hypothetical protein
VTDFAGSYNGWSFGVGTGFGLLEFSGFDDLSDVRSVDSVRPRDSGEFSSPDYAGGRVFTAKVLVSDTGVGDLWSNLEALKAATVPQVSPLPLIMSLPGSRSRLLYCRARRRSIPGTINYEFKANDPRWYASAASSAVLTAPTSTGGLAMPLTMPLTFGGGALTNSTSVLNSGDFETRPVVTIVGPCTGPQLSNGAGGSINFQGLTLASTDSLVVDFGARTAVLSGQSRYTWIVQPAGWFVFPPGSSTITFTASSASAGAQATVVYSSAWI